ncbi:hypothetical protein MWU75_09990 [Ornithinimicrobium sp. F0845]|uniref:ribbon-helix-helix protein n=1 Tax=Ornithinimicrobium sp. F0845 TaxID=2926412 RepID=UPI001FF106C3|nr:hypothetical protein [Ornithinimicrobium sp. F0845]MCK0112467.1 hypothetical protein [Ornithinimicrobium sp. F0845]
MTSTTIKVPSATRDRLKVHAARRGETLAAHIERLLDLADREDRFEQLREAIVATSSGGQVAYERERDAWLDADLT